MDHGISPTVTKGQIVEHGGSPLSRGQMEDQSGSPLSDVSSGVEILVERLTVPLTTRSFRRGVR